MNILQIERLSVKSASLDFSFWVKVGQTFRNLFIGSNRMIVCSESSIVEVTFTFSFRTLRYFSSGPSPLCSSTCLLRPLLLSLSLLDVTSLQQYIFLHRHKITVHLNSSLNRPSSLLSCCLCFTQHVLGKNLLKHQQWKYGHSHLIETSAIPLSFQLSGSKSSLVLRFYFHFFRFYLLLGGKHSCLHAKSSYK